VNFFPRTADQKSYAQNQAGQRCAARRCAAAATPDGGMAPWEHWLTARRAQLRQPASRGGAVRFDPVARLCVKAVSAS